MKTIKTIADELGVSTQAVYKKKKQEPLATQVVNHCKLVGNKIYLDGEAERLIKQAFGTVPTEESCNQVANDCKPVDNSCKPVDNPKDKLIEILEAELKAKTEIIQGLQSNLSEVTRALENTTEALHASQALHAGTLSQALDDGTATLISEEEKKKKKFWKWSK